MLEPIHGSPRARRCPPRPRHVALCLVAWLATTVAGCGGPEKSGAVDLEALRKEAIAQGKAVPVRPLTREDLEKTKKARPTAPGR
jgi:hypothetical protein